MKPFWWIKETKSVVYVHLSTLCHSVTCISKINCDIWKCEKYSNTQNTVNNMQLAMVLWSPITQYLSSSAFVTDLIWSLYNLKFWYNVIHHQVYNGPKHFMRFFLYKPLVTGTIITYTCIHQIQCKTYTFYFSLNMNHLAIHSRKKS